MPEISVIIPAFNAQKTIEQCLNSLFAQSFTDFEVIVVNDGSTDQTAQVLQKYQTKIKIVNQSNSGAPAARNAGAKLAAGAYLLFCDADIVLKPQALEKMYQALKNHPDKSYTYCNFIFGHKKFKVFDFDAARLKQMPYIHTTSLVVKKDFSGFNQNLKRFQDWDLWLTMLEQGKTGIHIPEILFQVKSGGTMSSWLPKIFYKLPFLKQVKKYKQAEKIIKEKHHL
ncbi:MAG: glycosyltransferase family 2 protein [Candidatus Buchananbacteria bacterium]|nr:glycosyltransferase family 2 protein [Candidatus Buchananbacteria bacterium]